MTRRPRRGPASAPSPAPAPAKDAPNDPRAARALQLLWVGLIVLALLRAILAFVPGMWAWGLDLLRFIAPLPGWIAWSLAALALVPAVARRFQGAFARAGDVVAHHPVAATWALGVAVAIVVGSLPDRTRFVGDFLLRQGSAMGDSPTSVLFPQALPLDLLIHHHLARWLSGALALDVNGTERVLGALEVTALAAAAVACARSLELRGIAAAAVTAVILLGGGLGLFTGYGKAFREMCVLAAWIGALALRSTSDARGLLPLGLVVAIGLSLHRSAVAFLPALAAAWAIQGPRLLRAGELRRPRHVAAVLLPLATLAAMAPRMITAARTIDRAHFVAPGMTPVAALLAIVEPVHLADVANTVVQLAPLAWVALLIAPWISTAGARPGERLVLVAFALPFVAQLLIIRPQQGEFRDWDVFAACGVALSVTTAWALGRALRAAPRAGWIGVGIALAVAAPTAQWLVHAHDPARGLARIEAYLTEPPPRPEPVRATTYSFVATVHRNLGHRDQAAAAYGQAATLAPSPRLLYEWAVAEADRGDLATASEVLHRAAEKAPNMAQVWLTLGMVEYRRGVYGEARRAVERSLELIPGAPPARALLDSIGAAERRAATVR